LLPVTPAKQTNRKAGTWGMVGFKQAIWAAAAAAALLAQPARASILDTVGNVLNIVVTAANPFSAPAQAPAESDIRLPPLAVKAAEDSALHPSALPQPTMPALPAKIMAELPQPSVERPLKKFFCAEYARARSGLALFGDAKYWWSRAKNLYTRAKTPMENAVMVFKVTSRLRLGHVAVVTRVVSSREIRVDQANWQNHGEIDHSTPIMDVSAKNDWSQVRVWDIKSQQYGRVYPVSGFIIQNMTREAANETTGQALSE
jgi:hypothetical protein